MRFLVNSFWRNGVRTPVGTVDAGSGNMEVVSIDEYNGKVQALEQDIRDLRQQYQQRSDAWMNVCGLLSSIYPEWQDLGTTANDGALAAIQDLAKRGRLSSDAERNANALRVIGLVLDELCPGWSLKKGNMTECAERAIRGLASESVRVQRLKQAHSRDLIRLRTQYSEDVRKLREGIASTKKELLEVADSLTRTLIKEELR